MAYYDALIAFWPSVTGDSTAVKLAALNAMTAAGPDQKVLIVDATNYLRINGVWLGIKAAAGTVPAAAAAVDIVQDLRQDTLDFSLPIIPYLVGALVTAELITQDQADGLTALKNTIVPWWQANGYPREFDLGDIAAAGLS